MDVRQYYDQNSKKPHLSVGNRKIFGVCGGLGEYYDISPAAIRLSWIVLMILTGVVPGIVAYVVAAIVMPKGV
jgi:phage shock protein C